MATGIRTTLRFPPDEGAVAWIGLEVPEDKSDFTPTIPALVTDEALNGCGLVALANDQLGVGVECMVQVGELPPLNAQVRWIRELGEGVQKIGVAFLE